MLCLAPRVPQHLGRPRGQEGLPAQCPVSATEGIHPVGVSLALGGWVGATASNAQFFPHLHYPRGEALGRAGQWWTRAVGKAKWGSW